MIILFDYIPRDNNTFRFRRDKNSRAYDKMRNVEIRLNEQTSFALNQSLQEQRKRHDDSNDRVRRSFATAGLAFLTNACTVFTLKDVLIVEVDTLVIPRARVVQKSCLNAFAGLVGKVIRRDASTTSIDAHRTVKRVLTVVVSLTMITLHRRPPDTIRGVPRVQHERILAGARSLFAFGVRHGLTRQVIRAI